MTTRVAKLCVFRPGTPHALWWKQGYMGRVFAWGGGEGDDDS